MNGICFKYIPYKSFLYMRLYMITKCYFQNMFARNKAVYTNKICIN